MGPGENTPPYATPGYAPAPPPHAPPAYVSAPPPHAPLPHAPPPQLTQGPYGRQTTYSGYQTTGAYQPPPYPGGFVPGPNGSIHQQNYGTVTVPPQMSSMFPYQLPPPGLGNVETPSVVTVQPAENIILVGGCPACRIGVLEDDFTCGGILLAIMFFPFGFLCCLAMKQRKCPNCGASFA